MPKLGSLVSHLKIAWYGLLATLVLLLLILSAANGTSVSSISIKLRDGQKDYLDKSIPFVTKPGEELPDYRVSYLADGGWLSEGTWHTVGTAFNRSATNWIEFMISDPPNLTLVQGVRVTEEDTAEDDQLEEVQLVELPPAGSMFEYRIETGWSFKAGMMWFATTPLGMAIFGAIGLAVFLVVMSHLASAMG